MADSARSTMALALAALAVTAVGCGGGGGKTRPSADTDVVARADRAGDGTGGGAPAEGIRLSANGRYAVFSSTAADLVPGVSGGVSQVYRKDLQTGAVVLVSRAWNIVGQPIGTADSESPDVSDDGSVVVFTSMASLAAGEVNPTRSIFAVDLNAESTFRVAVGVAGAQPNGLCQDPRVSGDGSVVVYDSYASNLVAGDGNGHLDVFAYQRFGIGAGVTRRLSVTGAGAEKLADSARPCVARDGLDVAFQSTAQLTSTDTNLMTDIYKAKIDWSASGPPLISRVSVTPSDASPDPDGYCFNPSISADGMLIAYESTATNLVAGGSGGMGQIFVYDRTWLETRQISFSSAGAEATGTCGGALISGDGRYVVFNSIAPNLVAGDTNGTWDVFVRDRTLNTTRRLSVSATGAQNDGASSATGIARDGSAAGFQALGTVLPGSDPAVTHVYRVLIAPSAGG